VVAAAHDSWLEQLAAQQRGLSMATTPRTGVHDEFDDRPAVEPPDEHQKPVLVDERGAKALTSAADIDPQPSAHGRTMSIGAS
jgi:hypothetical protein